MNRTQQRQAARQKAPQPTIVRRSTAGNLVYLARKGVIDAGFNNSVVAGTHQRFLPGLFSRITDRSPSHGV